MYLSAVLPLAREWIEIVSAFMVTLTRLVLPLAREWIEIYLLGSCQCPNRVLPLAREWIEILEMLYLSLKGSPFSLLRGSGLKCQPVKQGLIMVTVLPLAREWIEIISTTSFIPSVCGSPSCEGVD